MDNISETLQKKRAELKEVFDNPAEEGGKYSAEQKNAINGLNTELAELGNNSTVQLFCRNTRLAYNKLKSSNKYSTVLLDLE